MNINNKTVKIRRNVESNPDNNADDHSGCICSE